MPNMEIQALLNTHVGTDTVKNSKYMYTHNF